MEVKNVILKNDKEETIYPQTSLDQVIDKKTGKPLDRSYDELHKKSLLAYENSKNNKVYTTLEEIGIEYGSETIKDIAYNLPSNSTLIYHKQRSGGNPDVFPSQSGILTVLKTNNASRVSFKFERSDMYHVGFFYFLNTSNPNDTEKMWSGWYNLKGFKSFISFEEIGLTGGSETIKSIVDHMKFNSILQVLIKATYGNSEIYPTGAGILTVKKAGDNGRISFIFESEHGVYFGYYNSYYESRPNYSAWTGWKNSSSIIDNFEEIGINAGNETIEEIVKKIPTQSTIQL